MTISLRNTYSVNDISVSSITHGHNKGYLSLLPTTDNEFFLWTLNVKQYFNTAAITVKYMHTIECSTAILIGIIRVQTASVV
jgi:hypothetical protein